MAGSWEAEVAARRESTVRDARGMRITKAGRLSAVRRAWRRVKWWNDHRRGCCCLACVMAGMKGQP